MQSWSAFELVVCCALGSVAISLIRIAGALRVIAVCTQTMMVTRLKAQKKEKSEMIQLPH